MAIKIGNLWRDVKLRSLHRNSRLLYIYLASHNDLSTVGTVCIDLDIAMLELNLNLDELRNATVQLTKSGYIITQHIPNEGVYFAVIKHYDSLAKSEMTVNKAKKDLLTIPEGLQKKLLGYIDLDSKFLSFKEPTEQEVAEFAMSKGYIIDAKEFIRFYSDNGKNLGKQGWYDGRGRAVKNWKGKLTKVWFKEDRKLTKCEGAPEGFEYFYIMYDGKMVTPTSWRNGKPYSSDGMTFDKKLQEEYARKTNG